MKLMTGHFISIVNVDEVLGLYLLITMKKEHLRYNWNSIAQEWNKESYHYWQTLKKVFPCLQKNRRQY